MFKPPAAHLDWPAKSDRSCQNMGRSQAASSMTWYCAVLPCLPKHHHTQHLTPRWPCSEHAQALRARVTLTFSAGAGASAAPLRLPDPGCSLPPLALVPLRPAAAGGGEGAGEPPRPRTCLLASLAFCCSRDFFPSSAAAAAAGAWAALPASFRPPDAGLPLAATGWPSAPAPAAGSLLPCLPAAPLALAPPRRSVSSSGSACWSSTAAQ
jgi:hypothetical protein